MSEGLQREIVGLFARQAEFEKCVETLVVGAFARSDLSVLSSHQSIDAAGKPAKAWKDALSALVGEMKYEGPLVASGAILLAGGATAAMIAGLIGAAVGGVALKELLDEVTSTPDTEEFSRSVAAGSIILWVCVENSERAETASRILSQCGATNVHPHQSDTSPPD